jgi:hypothetical protein
MNKYLEKIASLGSFAESAREFGKDFAKGWKRSSTTSKVGLGMSASGLGLGVANYKNGVENKHNNVARNALEQESLKELKGISESLKKKPKVTVNLKLHQEKEASLRSAAHDAMNFAKRNPLTAAGTVLGASDGALSTTKKKNESYVRAGLRGVRNTIAGGVTGAAVGAIGDHLRNKYLR